jgi:hypothetical protein
MKGSGPKLGFPLPQALCLGNGESGVTLTLPRQITDANRIYQRYGRAKPRGSSGVSPNRKNYEKLRSVNGRVFFRDVELDFVPSLFTVRPFNELVVHQFLLVIRKS